ncbi:MAG: hypothetical protein LQ348_007642 [Seirophora lacunosa]|nr:MAG: hypothetical protein LQ348_007642 [Seirophora lacunosa]
MLELVGVVPRPVGELPGIGSTNDAVFTPAPPEDADVARTSPTAAQGVLIALLAPIVTVEVVEARGGGFAGFRFGGEGGTAGLGGDGSIFGEGGRCGSGSTGPCSRLVVAVTGGAEVLLNAGADAEVSRKLTALGNGRIDIGAAAADVVDAVREGGAYGAALGFNVVAALALEERVMLGVDGKDGVGKESNGGQAVVD